MVRGFVHSVFVSNWVLMLLFHKNRRQIVRTVVNENMVSINRTIN